jgi:flagellar M-ring protein FliF
VSGILDQLRSYYEGLQPGQQRILAASLLLAVIALGAVGWWSANEGYDPIFTSSNPADIQVVADALDDQGIAYQVGNDGRTLMVRPEDEGRARLASAGAGKIIGYESLESIELGTSPQREQWAYQRALEGELSQTVASLGKVAKARVHLDLPEDSPFLRDQRPPSASVLVSLLPGAALTSAEARGITALVSGSVNGLKPANVVVVDQDGEVLAGGEDDDGMLAGANALMAMQLAEEKRTEAAIEKALRRVLGSANDLDIGVTVELETTAKDVVRRSVDDEKKAMISESIREEASESTRPSGVPGTASNLPEQGGEGNAASQNREVSEIRSNYEPSRVEERETRAPGSVKRVSVGIMVNSDAVRKLAVGSLTKPEGEAPTEEEITARIGDLEKQIEQTARTAMGFSDNRDDSLTVTYLPFSATATDDQLVDESGNTWLTESSQSLLLLGLAVLLFFFLVIRPLVAAVAKAAEPPLPPALEPGVDATSALVDKNNLGLVDSTFKALEDDDESRREASRNLTERLRSMVDNFENVDAADLNRLVDLEREATAQVLRRWIREG